MKYEVMIGDRKNPSFWISRIGTLTEGRKVGAPGSDISTKKNSVSLCISNHCK